MQICKLCENKVDKLIKSHIIPECFYRDVYDDKHRYISIEKNNYKQLKIEQLGFQEELLCKDCETRFSKWENIVKKDFNDFDNEKSNYLSINKIDDNCLIIKNIKYNEFKKGILSILWRMSISKMQHFAVYNLGLYEEILRQILVSDDIIREDSFSIIINKIVFNTSKKSAGFIVTIGKWRLENAIIQRFIIDGMDIHVIVTRKDKPKVLETIILKNDGSIIIPYFKVSELNLGADIWKRIYDDDVRGFFEN